MRKVIIGVILNMVFMVLQIAVGYVDLFVFNNPRRIIREMGIGSYTMAVVLYSMLHVLALYLFNKILKKKMKF